MWLDARGNISLQILRWVRRHTDLVLPEDYDVADRIAWCWQKWWKAATLIVFEDVQKYTDIQTFLQPPSSQFRTLQKLTNPAPTISTTTYELVATTMGKISILVVVDLAKTRSNNNIESMQSKFCRSIGSLDFLPLLNAAQLLLAN